MILIVYILIATQLVSRSSDIKYIDLSSTPSRVFSELEPAVSIGTIQI